MLVAHGYFNAILGRTLGLRGWRKVAGAHRARFWNTVVYERDTASHAAPAPKMPSRIRRLGARIRGRGKAKAA